MITFSDETSFVNALSLTGPLNAPFSAVTDAVTVGDNLFTVRPGAGVPAIAVSNIIDNSLASDLLVDGRSFSNLDFSFQTATTAFGFTVDSFTAPGYQGPSSFSVTFFDGSIEVGRASFETPAAGEIFFGFSSTVPFNFLILRETAGGPQNETEFGGAADREFFGKFYRTPVPEPTTMLLLGTSLAGLGAVLKKRRVKGQ